MRVFKREISAKLLRIVCCLFWLASTAQTLLAQTMPLSADLFALRSLKVTTTHSTEKNTQLATLAMIYQPDCSWCKKQGKMLVKAFEQCQDSINIALVGTQGNVSQLKKELRHYHKNMPAFIADSHFLRNIGGYQASPTTLIFDQQGLLISKKRGFIAQEKLAKALRIISQGACAL